MRESRFLTIVIMQLSIDVQVPDALRRSLQALLQQLAQASSVGLIDLKVADTASGIKTAHPAPEDQSNSHDQSLESCMQNAKITGESCFTCQLILHAYVSAQATEFFRAV